MNRDLILSNMKNAENDLKVHVFVCTTKKNGECCALRGGEELRRDLKEWTRTKPEWKGKIRINSSGCLDRCTEGVAIAIYPQDQWLINASPENLEEIKTVITGLMPK